MDAEKIADKIYDKNLRKTADAGGDGPSNHEGGSWSGCDKDLIQDSHIPFPNESNSVKDRNEEDALGQDAGSDEV